MKKILLIHPFDNLMVALKDLAQKEKVSWNDNTYELVDAIPAKHKFAMQDFAVGDIIYLYGSPVGKATKVITKGSLINVDNIIHYSAEVKAVDKPTYEWHAPDISAWKERTFKGYVRDDGRVGTANYWLIIPLVFCQNRNVQKLQDALAKPLGYKQTDYSQFTASLLGTKDEETISNQFKERIFPNVDGVRGIIVNSGCGGTAYDAKALCQILAAYADHPNVAGITVFSLGCEKAQGSLFDQVLKERNPHFNKPHLFFRQQDWPSEDEMMQAAIEQTLGQLKQANNIERTDVPLSHLKIGVKCGGSDGFSGISANPAMGIVSDMLIALGGASALAEFPELCGAEGNIVERCIRIEDQNKFIRLMQQYEAIANQDGTSISDNPSPGNIKDGLITDAIKSLGAAKKGGTAPINGVKDYGEAMEESGLSLTCTPGNDLEAVTGQVAAGANIIIFSTGLGTPTGNPIVPVLKIATNSIVAEKLSDMIDFDCGPVIEGVPLQEVAENLFEKVIMTASGDYIVKADLLEQYDFLFWKRKTSL